MAGQRLTLSASDYHLDLFLMNSTRARKSQALFNQWITGPYLFPLTQ